MPGFHNISGEPMSVNKIWRALSRASVLVLVTGLVVGGPLVRPDAAVADDPVVVTPAEPAPGDPAAEDPPADPPVPSTYSPKVGPLFNDPSGSHAQQYALNTYLVRAIDNTPAGATIRMSLYSGSIDSFKDALIAAHDRGVNVRLIMDGHGSVFDWWRGLVTALGSDRTSSSFATVCRYSCFDTRHSTLQHSKLYLFSATGIAQRVSVVGSGNPTTAQAEIGWNDLFAMVNNQPMYDAFVEFFDAMVASAATADEVNYYRVVDGGSARAIISPAQYFSVKDYYGEVLNNIHCKAAPGYGVKGKTKVTVAMGLWSKSRVRNAKRLWQLDQAGCVVEAIVSSHDLDSDVKAWLRKPTRHGGISFRAASVDFGRNGTIDRYLHEKIVMVSGGYARQLNATLTFMGSHNFTYNAMRGNNDIILRHTDKATYDQLIKHVLRLRQRTTVVSHTRGRVVAGTSGFIELTPQQRALNPAEAFED